MTERESEVQALAKVIWRASGRIIMSDALVAARAILAAGYERRRDVAEADALRKQVRG